MLAFSDLWLDPEYEHINAMQHMHCSLAGLAHEKCNRAREQFPGALEVSAERELQLHAQKTQSLQLRSIRLKHHSHRVVGSRQDHHLIADGAAKGNGLSARSLARYRLQIRSQFRSFSWIAREQRDRVSARDQPSADAATYGRWSHR